LLTESQLKGDFDCMQFVILQEIERDVREGWCSKTMSCSRMNPHLSFSQVFFTQATRLLFNVLQ
jgi:hypothetical protein